MTSVGFEEFVAARYRDLVAFAFAVTLDVPTAQDVTQDALAACWRRWSRIDNPDAYVRVCIARTATKRAHRRSTSLELTDDLLRLAAGRDVAGEVAGDRAALALLAGLPPRMRAVLALRYLQDLSDAAVADALGISVGTVKSQAARGLAKLRESLAMGRETV